MVKILISLLKVDFSYFQCQNSVNSNIVFLSFKTQNLWTHNFNEFSSCKHKISKLETWNLVTSGKTGIPTKLKKKQTFVEISRIANIFRYKIF